MLKVRRFLRQDVKSRATQYSVSYGAMKRIERYDPASGRVDEDRAALHLSQPFIVYEIGSCGGQWAVEREDVNSRQQISEVLHAEDSESKVLAGRRERIMVGDGQSERFGAKSECAANPAKSDDTESPSGKPDDRRMRQSVGRPAGTATDMCSLWAEMPRHRSRISPIAWSAISHVP